MIYLTTMFIRVYQFIYVPFMYPGYSITRKFQIDDNLIKKDLNKNFINVWNLYSSFSTNSYTNINEKLINIKKHKI